MVDRLTVPDLVDAAYLGLLGRPADPAGFETYVGALRGDRLTAAELLASFVSSDEFRDRHRGAWHHISFQGLTYVFPVRFDATHHLAVEGYEPWLMSVFLARCRPGMRILDIGASWGAFTLPASRAVGSEGRVVAVEASPLNCRVLVRSLAANGIANVDLLPLGVSDKFGFAMANLSATQHNNILNTDGDPTQQDIIPLATIDGLADAIGHVDIVKIDIEGMEYRALVGGLRLIERDRPVVFCEYSPLWQQQQSQVSGETLLRLFIDRGYAVDLLHRNRAPERTVMPARVDEAYARHVEVDGGSHLDLCFVPPAQL